MASGFEFQYPPFPPPCAPPSPIHLPHLAPLHVPLPCLSPCAPPTGDQSRNRTVGLRLGKGEKLEDIIKSTNAVAEGVLTSR